MLVSRPLTIPKILGGKARGRKKVSPAIKWDRTSPLLGLGRDGSASGFVHFDFGFLCVGLRV
jgi:hypothetical protein